MKAYVIPVTAYQQNCSLLVCEETHKAALVDPGGDLPKLLEAIEKLGCELEKIFLTHAHMDHCAGAGVLRQQLNVPIEGPQKEDIFWLEKLPEWCKMAGFPIAEAFEPDRWLEEGDTIHFGNVTLDVRHCPGHTPGHVVFFHPESKLAFVGDVLFQGSIGRTDFPRGDYDTLVASIRDKLWPLGDDVNFVPGHGPNSTFGRERATNPFVSDKNFG
ncbi:MAG TPA: MBL fold metallo-hydrolase [Pseudomonadales bacterium]|nr:MBL fold metallo-hydrolase [Pseudomonadales bacterium]